MKILKNEIRPIGYVTLELSEAEIQTLISSIDELQMLKDRSPEEIMGLRGDVYQSLKKTLMLNQ